MKRVTATMATIALILWFATAGMLTAVSAKKTVVPLPEIVNPIKFLSDDTQFYIVEKDAVYIYRWQGIRFLKKFGQRGEGPQEFNISGGGGIGFSVHPDILIAYTYTKLLEYKKDGTYIREYRLRDNREEGYFGSLTKFGKFFIQSDLSPGDKVFENVSYYLCDEKLKKIKEICRARFPANLDDKKLFIFSPYLHSEFYKEMAFFSNEEKIEIIGLNSSGETFLHLNHDYERIKVTNDMITAYHEYFKTQHPNRSRYESLKLWFRFPDYFPAIRNFKVANGQVYVQTFKTNHKKESEILIFNLKGQYLRTTYLPIEPFTLETPNPYLFKDGHLFQLNEDIETETWNLHITPIH